MHSEQFDRGHSQGVTLDVAGDIHPQVIFFRRSLECSSDLFVACGIKFEKFVVTRQYPVAAGLTFQCTLACVAVRASATFLEQFASMIGMSLNASAAIAAGTLRSPKYHEVADFTHESAKRLSGRTDRRSVIVGDFHTW